MRFEWILIIIFLIMTGCTNSSSDEIIKKVEIDSEIWDDVEQETDVIIDDVIEISLDDEYLTIQLESIPILKQYLLGSGNRQEAINKIHGEHILTEERKLYLLEFSCVKDRCSYLLLDEDDNSILVADLAKYELTLPSPDQSKLLLKFSRPISDDSSNHNIVIVELATLEQRRLTNDMDDAITLNYTRPFSSVEWLDDETIAITSPDFTMPEQTTLLHIE